MGNGELVIPHGPRFLTLLIYLNDADGATVFPVGGWSEERREAWIRMSPEKREAKTRRLANACKGRIAGRSRKGSALLFYNHFVHERGVLGDLDGTTWHAACNVTSGVRWTANRWIQAPLPREVKPPRSKV